MRFAWGVVQHVKSNAIVLARAEDGGFVLNGVGAGQMSRIDSVRIAISKATRPVEGSVLASDAFFPFPDETIPADFPLELVKLIIGEYKENFSTSSEYISFFYDSMNHGS